MRNYLLGVLLALLICDKMEHAALGVVLQDIKHDLQLTDAQLGLLSGFAFTLFYAVMGIPIARWADRGNRVAILSVTTALQGAALALSALAGSFLQLLCIRVGVAVGEAGCVAPANSLIADYFDRGERPRATAWYMLGYPLSAVVGYFVGGWLSARYGWRNMFVWMGLPGLALAAISLATLREPRRVRTRFQAVAIPDLKSIRSTLWRNVTFRHLVLGYSLLTFFAIGVVLWTPTYFVRAFGIASQTLGASFAVVWGLGGLAGTYGIARWVSRHARLDEALQLKAMALVFAASSVLASGIYLTQDRYLALGLLTLVAAVNYGTAGPLFATIQTVVPERMRAVAVATTYLCTNLIGVGLGPWVVGALSDHLRPSLGNASLRASLLFLCPGYFWAAWHVWRASHTFNRDLAIALESH